jgi:hypothetical protein
VSAERTEELTGLTGYWVSNCKMTCMVVANCHTTVIEAPPILRRFLGQPMGNLLLWMSKKPGLQVEELP